MKDPWQANNSDDWLFGIDSMPEQYPLDQFPLKTDYWAQSSPSEILTQQQCASSSSTAPIAAMLVDETISQQQGRPTPYTSLSMIDRVDYGCVKSSRMTKESGPRHIDFVTLSAIHLDIDRLCPQSLNSAGPAAEYDSHEELLDKVGSLCAIVRDILGSAKTQRGEEPSLPCLDEPVPFLVFSTMLKVIASYQSIINSCIGASPPLSQSQSRSSSSRTQSPLSLGQISPVGDQAKLACARTPSTMMHLLSIDLHKLHSFNMIDYHLLHFMHLVLLFDFEPTRQEANILKSVRRSKDRILALHRRLRYFLSSACMAWDLSNTQESLDDGEGIGVQ